jgi:hypothetical protein
MLKMKTSKIKYDVFISYRHQEPDLSWVRETLVPRLESEGLRVCVDHQDFGLGEFIVNEMPRAVEESRYTLAVLTPAYLKSTFTKFENILADHLGLEESRRRLLMIMREPCNPELRLRARIWLDMTNDADFEMNVARLSAQLRQ